MENKHYKFKVKDIIDNKLYTPIALDVIPNYMGINLCSVDSIEWIKQHDGQLVNLKINFIPDNSDKNPREGWGEAFEEYSKEEYNDEEGW